MIAEFTATPLFAAWPFWVLALDPTADNRAIERAYQKCISSLQLKIPGAQEFMTPLGVRPRDEFLLREARAILTNPDSRALAEFWYLAPEAAPAAHTEPTSAPAAYDWHKILRTL
jgi:hypothetical protein